MNDTESKTATQSSTHASSLRSSLKLNSTEHMDDIWERARRYGGDGEWTFATGKVIDINHKKRMRARASRNGKAL